MRTKRTPSTYYELAVTSNFSFLRGASHPEELVEQAARLCLGGLAITDRNSLAGVVRGHMAAKEAGLPFATGCRLVFMDATPDIFVWPQNREAYGRLCELLSLGKLRAPKSECHLTRQDLIAHGEGLLIAVSSQGNFPQMLEPVLEELKPVFGGRLYLGLCRHFHSDDQRQMAALATLAARLSIPLLALGDVYYHVPEAASAAGCADLHS